MPFPTIKHCIICEDVRQEIGRKATLAGFYGITPDVEILLDDPTRPIEKLVFVFIAGPGDGTHQVTADLRGPDDQSILNIRTELRIVEAGARNNNLSMKILAVKFPALGLYTFRLSTDGVIRYDARFEIRAKPRD